MPCLPLLPHLPTVSIGGAGKGLTQAVTIYGYGAVGGVELQVRALRGNGWIPQRSLQSTPCARSRGWIIPNPGMRRANGSTRKSGCPSSSASWTQLVGRNCVGSGRVSSFFRKPSSPRTFLTIEATIIQRLRWRNHGLMIEQLKLQTHVHI